MAGEAASGTSSACNSFLAQPSDQKTILPRSSTLSRGSLHPPRPNLKTPHPSSPHRYFFDSSQAPAHPRTEQGWGCSLLRGRKKQIQILKKSQIISSRIKTRPRGANGVAHPSMPGFPLNYLLFWCKQSGYRSYHGAGDPSCLLSGFIRAFFFFLLLAHSRPDPGLAPVSCHPSPRPAMPGIPLYPAFTLPSSAWLQRKTGDAQRRLPYCKSLYRNHFPQENEEIPPQKSTARSYGSGTDWGGGEKASKGFPESSDLKSRSSHCNNQINRTGGARGGIWGWFVFFFIPQ